MGAAISDLTPRQQQRQTTGKIVVAVRLRDQDVLISGVPHDPPLEQRGATGAAFSG